MGAADKITQNWRLAASPLLAFVLLAGCGQKNTYVAPPPPPQVTVAKPVQRTITNYLEATGNSAAVNTADLVARVSGFVQSIDYKDGDAVKKGKVLFVIEPQTYDLKLKQAQAAEASACATLKQAQTDYERQAKLVTSGSVSKATLDSAIATRDNAQGTLQQAEVNTTCSPIPHSSAVVCQARCRRKSRAICGTAPQASAFFRQFIPQERCSHMSGLSARPLTAGLDEIRDARG